MPDQMVPLETSSFRDRSAVIAKLAEALATAQKNFAPIPKDREVTVHSDRGNYKFKYATLDAIRSATMPALAEQKLAIVQGMIEYGNGYAVETKLFHSSGEWIGNVTPMFVSGRMKDGRQYPPTNQELGSAQSYARRYGMSALLCITADEDDDGNTADGNHIEGSTRTPYKPAKGSAGAGGDFRPDGARRFPGTYDKKGAVADAERDGLVDTNRQKGTLPAKGGKLTPDEEKAAKVKAATDKRITVLKSKSVWTRPELDQLWKDDAKWIDWMADPANEVLKEYERFTDAYAEAEMNSQEAA